MTHSDANHHLEPTGLNPMTAKLLRRLPATGWVDIAATDVSDAGLIVWRAAECAPFTLPQARRLYDDGLVELAQMRDGDRMVLMVCRRQQVAQGRVPLWGKKA